MEGVEDLAGLTVFEAWRCITDERARQINAEGWDDRHDDGHATGEMLRAAVCYIRHGRDPGPEDTPPMSWPWNAAWWKPKSRRSNLIRAGALCLAERDRCIRKGLRTGPADHKIGIVLRELVLLAATAEPSAWLHVPTGNVLRATDFAAMLPKWTRQFADPHTADEIEADFVPLFQREA